MREDIIFGIIKIMIKNVQINIYLPQFENLFDSNGGLLPCEVKMGIANEVGL